MICPKCGVMLPNDARICCTCMTVIPHEGETAEQAREIAKAQCSEMLRQAQAELARAESASQQAEDNPPTPLQDGGQQQPAPQSQLPYKPTSGMAITSLVLGILAIATSFVPIVNNGSFFIAIIAFAFAIAGIIATGKLKEKKGRGIAIAGLVLSIASIVLVLVTQSFYGSLFNQLTDRLQHGEKPVATSTSNVDHSQMELGQSVMLENGMVISVNEVETSTSEYNNRPMTRVNVTYANNGSSKSSFNVFDWKAEDASGAERTAGIRSGDDDLGSGVLKPGGNVTGNVYFEGDIAKVYYYSNGITQSDSSICWIP